MAFFVYIMQCEDGTFYTGYTNDLHRRARQHANGKGARYTRSHKPLEIAYFEIFESRGAAMKREKQIKKLSHDQKADLIKTPRKT
jgi:putative endonuclease